MRIDLGQWIEDLSGITAASDLAGQAWNAVTGGGGGGG